MVRCFSFFFFCCCFWALTPVANIPQDFAIKRFCGIGPSQEWGCFFLSCRLLRNSFELKKKKWFNSFWVVCDGTMKLFFNSLRSSLAVNALYACVYIYIRQLLLGWPRCGLSIWLSYLPYSVHRSEFMLILLTRKRTKHENTRSATFVWKENGRRRFLGAQSINTERTFKLMSSVREGEIINTVSKSKHHELAGRFHGFSQTPSTGCSQQDKQT